MDGSFVLVADIEGAEADLVSEWELIERQCAGVLIEFHEGSEELEKRFDESENFDLNSELGRVKYYSNTSL